VSPLSCFTNCYGRFGPEAAMRLLPQAGIRYVELAIKTHGVPSPFGETPLLTDASTPAEVEAARRLADAAGITLSSCNISSGNIVDPAAVVRTILKLDLAAALGVALVVGGGGEARSTTEERQLISHLRAIGDAAAERGIVYCCETHPGACQNAERMWETMHRVDHPHVRLNFDTGNLFYYNRNVDLPAALQRVAPYVRHVHLKDTPGGFQQWHFAELGSGCVDFFLVRTLLEEVGFAGPYSLEIEGVQGEPPLTLAEHHARVVASVTHLRRCGY
jgi:L-ribulose-5-phosphate 3-epimerase